MKPFVGMTSRPYGLPLMAAEYFAFVVWCFRDAECVARFKSETSIDIQEIVSARGIAAAIDVATGRQREAILGFVDWVTRELWGECQCPEGEACRMNCIEVDE